MTMHRLAIIAGLFTGLLGGIAHAQYPDRPIHLIVPQAAGSSTDTLTRAVAAAMSAELGKEIVVDDRPGGALTIGLDIARDFQPIALVSRGELLLAVSPKTPIHSVKELIDYAKQNPGKLLNASSSNGSPGHVGGELFKFMTGTDIVHVPYKGGAPAINDLIAGRVQVMFESLNSIAPFAHAGTVRGLAVSGDHRSPAFPDLPTIAEAGVPGYSATTWAGIIAPAGVPQPIVDRLNAAINAAIRSPAMAAFYARIGDEPAGGTPGEFGALIASDSKKWGDVIKRAGIKFE